MCVFDYFNESSHWKLFLDALSQHFFMNSKTSWLYFCKVVFWFFYNEKHQRETKIGFFIAFMSVSHQQNGQFAQFTSYLLVMFYLIIIYGIDVTVYRKKEYLTIGFYFFIESVTPDHAVSFYWTFITLKDSLW